MTALLCQIGRSCVCYPSRARERGRRVTGAYSIDASLGSAAFPNNESSVKNSETHAGSREGALP